MFPQFLSAPLTTIRAAFTKPSPPQEDMGQNHDGTLRIARPSSSASSATLGARPPRGSADLGIVLNHQENLMSNFWGGGVLPPPAVAATRRESTRGLPEKEKGSAGGEPSLANFMVTLEQGHKEPRTLARKLFWFGFLFPLLWIAGAVFLFSPTKYALDLERASVADAQDMLRHKAAYRVAEEKWARRCLISFMSFLGAVIIIVVTVVFAEKGM
ncbi:hypothetical protein C2E23DRAFT_882268 [Lenzites betulinus]|nr:hypothetical protein C2E23DRAFT_882268 [Lenzites betulinus]